jgi:hypothetical protein
MAVQTTAITRQWLSGDEIGNETGTSAKMTARETMFYVRSVPRYKLKTSVRSQSVAELLLVAGAKVVDGLGTQKEKNVCRWKLLTKDW